MFKTLTYWKTIQRLKCDEWKYNLRFLNLYSFIIAYDFIYYFFYFSIIISLYSYRKKSILLPTSCLLYFKILNCIWLQALSYQRVRIVPECSITDVRRSNRWKKKKKKANLNAVESFFKRICLRIYLLFRKNIYIYIYTRLLYYITRVFVKINLMILRYVDYVLLSIVAFLSPITVIPH